MATSLKKRTKLYFHNLYLDYKSVFIDVKTSAVRRPLRASLYGLTLAFVLNLFRTNEDLTSYQADFIGACTRMSAVTESLRNPKSYKFIHTVGDWKSKGMLREIDLGFTTLIYRADSSIDSALYRDNCKYLRPTWAEFVKTRIVDVCLLGHWLILEMKMRDYDINYDE